MKHSWPSRTDRAFPRPKLANLAQTDALVTPHNDLYIDGFQRAADMIVETVVEAAGDEGNPDSLFFPVAFLYRHHLELMLKELVKRGASLGVIQNPRTLGEHNLHLIWNEAAKLIDAITSDSEDDSRKAVERAILEFHRLDPAGQSFRYACDKSWSQHLTHAPRSVDLVNLKEKVAGVTAYLDAALAMSEI